jgi:hypothetical protein
MTENLAWAECLNATVNEQDKPFTTITCKHKKPTPTTIIPNALPRIEREVIITCKTQVPENNRVNYANYALNNIHCIIRHSADITLPPSILARINSNNKLVLMTNPTTPANAYVPYLRMLITDIKSLQPTDPRINGHWSTFLVHNVPTNAKLPAIKTEIETTYHSLRLVQDPCWLVPGQCYLNKSSSTLIISHIGAMDLKHLGTTSLAICNRMCHINAYFS